METKRLLSLDAFRGFTIAAMILVNNPGSWGHVYSPLLHADWNGLTPTDLIFPFFLFVVGVSITLAYKKHVDAGSIKSNLYRKIIFRSAKIFLVGLILNYIGNFDLAELRIAGVLQRIAIVFLVCSVLFLNTRWKTQVYIALGLLVFYWIMMTIVPTPGYEKAMLEPGVNFAAWIDSYLLPGKMWQGTWDPEGIFSTLPAITTGISGMLAGRIIVSNLNQDKKIIWLFTAGFIASVAGYLWSLNFPVNKNLWTSSYVMVTSGFAAIALAASIFVVDVLERKNIARVGIIFGANAITIYVLSNVLAILFYGTSISGNTLNQHFLNLFTNAGWSLKLGSFLYALFYIIINFIPALILYRRKIYIKL
jgi:predicted acyltransferase